MEQKKKSWTKPVFKRLEPTEELLDLFAAKADRNALPPVKLMK